MTEEHTPHFRSWKPRLCCKLLQVRLSYESCCKGLALCVPKRYTASPVIGKKTSNMIRSLFFLRLLVQLRTIQLQLKAIIQCEECDIVCRKIPRSGSPVEDNLLFLCTVLKFSDGENFEGICYQLFTTKQQVEQIVTVDCSGASLE